MSRSTKKKHPQEKDSIMIQTVTNEYVAYTQTNDKYWICSVVNCA